MSREFTTAASRDIRNLPKRVWVLSIARRQKQSGYAFRGAEQERLHVRFLPRPMVRHDFQGAPKQDRVDNRSGLTPHYSYQR